MADRASWLWGVGGKRTNLHSLDVTARRGVVTGAGSMSVEGWWLNSDWNGLKIK